MAADGAAVILQQLYLGGTAGPELPEAVMAFEDGGVLPPMLIPSPSPSPALPPPPSPGPPQGQACIPEQEALVLVSRLIADVSTLPLPSSLYCEGAPAPATVHAHVEQLLMRDPAVFLER